MFVSSPGDVSDERAIALDVVDRLRYDDALRERVDFDLVAWDRPGGGAPILATRTPQASIDDGLPRPSDCDIAVVLFWSRMGTPLPHPEYRRADGEPFRSGTEWEFEDAVRGARERGRPEVLLYRRNPMRPVDPEAPDADEHWRQARLVQDFFARQRDPRTGAILRGHNTYRTPEEFRTNLESHLKALALRLLEESTEQVAASPPPLWQGSPFPGLRAFTPRDAPIYFGRGRETDELIARVAASRFVAVVGASGTGKSSLVGAGLLPRLAAGALPDVPAWLLSEHRVGTRLDLDQTAATLAGLPPGAQALLFVDQFEELFTSVPEDDVEPFVAALAGAGPDIRVVVTIRSDFYHRCLELPALAALLETGHFPLSTPGDTLLDMITRPAERAGLRFEEGLVGRILSDTGRDPGALPLLAYTLDELYRTRGGTSTLGHAAYERLGGVRGAIGTRAEDTFQQLDEQARRSFAAVFRELVEVDEQGLASRRRAGLAFLAGDEPARRLVDAFTAARLLVRSAEPGREPVVFVAHEALFGSWIRLREWIELVREDLHVLRRFRTAAREWDEHGRTDAYRWQHERLVPVYDMVARLDPALDGFERDFAEPEDQRLLPVFRDPGIAPYRRQALLDRLVAIGETAIPGLALAIEADEPEVRNSAGAALARIGPPAIPALLTAAAARDAETRLVALGTLRQLDRPEVLPAFRKALRDKDERVRSLAVGALTAMTVPGAAAMLADAAADPDLDVRWRAVGALGALGEAAIDPLLTAMHDDDTRVRADARAAIQAIGAQYLDPLLDALRRPDARIRKAAAEALASVGPPAAATLARALRDEDADVRWRAADALCASGRGATEAVAPLVGVLDDQHAAIRQTAAEALGVTGKEEAIEPLVGLLSDDEVGVPEVAAEALTAIGERAEQALLDVVRDGTRLPARQLAATALANTGPSGRAGLASLLYRPKSTTIAVDALARCGQAAVPILLTVLRTAAHVRHREAAVATLRGIGDSAVPQLLAELDQKPEPGPNVRHAIARALGGMVAPKARTALARLLHDDDPAIREAAARGLGERGADALPTLVRALMRPQSQAAAAEGLRVVGGDAVPELLKVARTESPVRDTVVELLRSIGTPAALLGLSELGLLTADR